ncbi:MAG: 5-nucleotidase [Chitinophagaceae bacterium]|nr:5-nucleotidase [Chitinophagaceae bacterium]
MNKVIGFSITNLGRRKPDAMLGDFVVDCMRQVAAEKFNTKVDAAIMNEGGIRIGYIGKGDITMVKVYELMPFDNVLVLQNIKGDVLWELLDHVAGKGGWPMEVYLCI